MRIGDLLVVSIILTLGVAVLLLFSHRQETVIIVTQNGRMLYTFDLSDPTLDGNEYIVGGKYSNTIYIRDKKLFVSEATCPDQSCVHSLPLSDRGGVICCVPNGVVITAKNNDIYWDVVLQ